IIFSGDLSMFAREGDGKYLGIRRRKQIMMNEARKIVYKIILLLIDILVFTYQIVRKVVLPARRRKGNILSSLLTFFVGLIERVMSFEKSILRQPVVFTHKYVKQALILAVGFLFLLSSVEWTAEHSSAATVNETQAVIIDEPADDAVSVLTQRQVNASLQIPPRDFIPAYLFPYFSFPLPHVPSPVQTRLPHCNSRL